MAQGRNAGGAEAGLAVYLMLARRPSGGSGARALRRRPADVSPSASGPCIWLHCERPPGLAAAAALIRAARGVVADDRGPPFAGLHPQFVLTTAFAAADPGRTPLPGLPPRGATTVPVPIESPGAVRAFLDHWQPVVGAFVGGDLRPALLHLSWQRGIDLFQFDAPEPALAAGVPTWIPGLTAAALRRFTRIMARSPAAHRALLRAGAPDGRIESGGPLQDGPGPLPHTEAERAALAQVLGARPVWVAADVPAEEEDVVLAAHRAAQRHSHRLLLLLVPRDPGRAATVVQKAQARRMRVARRSDDAEPGPEVSVYLADTEDEMGLWFRLATIAYLGGTLTYPAASVGAPFAHPFAPAALGAAVLHGSAIPHAQRRAYADLAAARAARRVRGADDMGAAVGDLLAPERAAEMAANAWAVTSARDETTERAARLMLSAAAERVAARAGAPGIGMSGADVSGAGS